MSLLSEMMAEGGRDTLLEGLGDVGAIELAADGVPVQFDAIVGLLRQEDVPVVAGSVEKWVQRDIVRLSVRCPIGTIHPKMPLKIFRYTTGDPSSHEQQMFHVRLLQSVTESWTSLEAWRDSLVKVQARGTEVA